MYKVKPEDLIKVFRTTEEVRAVEAAGIKQAGFYEEDLPEVKRLHNEIEALARDLDRAKVLTMVETMYAFADLSSKLTQDNAACQKGCSWCCQVNVEVSSFEAVYIEVRLGKELVVQRPYDKPNGSAEIDYCPFHDDKSGTCQIHDIRPLACRGFYAFDGPKYCEGSSTTHAIMSHFANPNNAPMIDILEQTTKGVKGDIRYWFGERKIDLSAK